MFLAAMSIVIMAGQASATETARPPRPSDEAILQTVFEKRPSAVILEHTARDVRNGGRVICGLVRHADTIEPFAAYTIWEEPSSIRIIENGRPVPVPPAQWKSNTFTPVETASVTGEADRRKRNANGYQRGLALSVCRDLAAPAGARWATTQEPHPNPDRQRLIEQRARATTDMLFRGRQEASPDRPN
jgi:hypothetical protein